MKEEKEKKTTKKSIGKGARIAGYIIAIALNLAFIYVLNNLLDWHVSWLKDSFVAPLAIFNISLSFTILSNLCFILYDSSWFKSLLQLIQNLLSILAISTLYAVFPFNVSSQMSQNIRIILILAILGTAIGAIVEFVKLIVNIVKICQGIKE